MELMREAVTQAQSQPDRLNGRMPLFCLPRQADYTPKLVRGPLPKQESPYRVQKVASLPLVAILVCLLPVWRGYAVDSTNREINLVSFFKEAINSPPDIEKYLAKRTNLQLPTQNGLVLSNSSSSSFQYLEGAISGTNFFLKRLSGPSERAGSNHLGTISARSGSSTYGIGGNGLIQGIGKNGLTDDIQAQFRLSRQVTGMGAGEIEPGSVRWDGNNFTAKNTLGKDIHGSLEVSNNLPLRMEVTLANATLPYKAIDYTYAIQSDSFSGYPAKFLISYKSTNGLKPLAVVEFESMRIAPQDLQEDFFAASRFSDRVSYTNVYSNSDFYASHSKTKRLVKANSYVTSGGFTNSNSRALIYLCLMAVTILPGAILLIRTVRNAKNKKQQKENK